MLSFVKIKEMKFHCQYLVIDQYNTVGLYEKYRNVSLAEKNSNETQYHRTP